MTKSTQETFEAVITNNLRAAVEIAKNDPSIDIRKKEWIIKSAGEIKLENNLHNAILKSNALIYSTFEQTQ